MLSEISLAGKHALVTGGATGLGFGIASELADAGAKVMIVGRRENLLVEAAQKIGCEYRVMDITASEELPGAVEQIEQEFGPLDILVNNAGMQNNKLALQYTTEEVEQIFRTNVFGSFTLTREVARRMCERHRGSIIFITSTAAHIGMDNNLAYSGSKGALSAMVRAFAAELSPQGVRVNAIAPGWIETDLVKESLRRVPHRRAAVEHRVLLGRLGTPKDIGMTAAFLASDAAAYLTGIEIKVDGGIGISL